jgi:hypothetical protein
VINDILPRRLREIRSRLKRQPFHTSGHRMGRFIVKIDNVAEAIAYGEGENFK